MESEHTYKYIFKYILLLDSSTDHCSVALAQSSAEATTILAAEEERDRSKQSERLAVMAHEVLSQLPEGEKLSAICVAEGPGSYTGLRIAAGYAKGLAFAQVIPLVAIPTTLLMVRSYLAAHPECDHEVLLMPMIDARRMEVYSALYSREGEAETDIDALVLTEPEVQHSLKDLVGERKLIYFGSGAEKAESLFTELLPHSHLQKGIVPQAKDMAGDAFGLLESGKMLDVAYWEPFYLKEYQAKKSLNKVLKQSL